MGEAGKTGNPYEGFAKSDLILRDQLAIDRTLLGNERTVLAYIRTGLALAIAGAACIKLFEDGITHLGGYALIACGFPLAAFGIYRFLVVRKNIRAAGSGSNKARPTDKEGF